MGYNDNSEDYSAPCIYNLLCNDRGSCDHLKRANCGNYRAPIELGNYMASKNIISVLELVEIIKS